MESFLYKKDLERMVIDHYLEDLISDPNIDFTEDMLDDDEVAFPYKSADNFRQGSCQLFAFALKEKFGYKVFKIQSGISFHIFCKSDHGDKYIDARGVMPDFESFITGSEMPNLESDISTEYCFEPDDFAGEFDDIGLSFARAIIKRNPELYTI